MPVANYLHTMDEYHTRWTYGDNLTILFPPEVPFSLSETIKRFSPPPQPIIPSWVHHDYIRTRRFITYCIGTDTRRHRHCLKSPSPPSSCENWKIIITNHDNNSIMPERRVFPNPHETCKTDAESIKKWENIKEDDDNDSIDNSDDHQISRT